MRLAFLALACAGALTGLSAPVRAAPPCGGDFNTFLQGLKPEARARGIDSATFDRFTANLRQDPKVLRADRAQGVFQMPFVEFSRRLISQNRIDRGRAMARRHGAVFDRIEAEFGLPREVLLAFWAFETDYGAVQGDFNTANALATLAHDCRRPDLFRPQLLAAMELQARGDFDPATTTGAWAGEIGMVQMLPQDILDHGIDGDGDGHVDLKASAADALMSGARMLAGLGWHRDQPWLQEIRLPDDLDLALTGTDQRLSVADWQARGVTARNGSLGPAQLMASVLLPQGKDGPAFLAYPNFEVYFEWNQSFVYVLTAGYFATRLGGAAVYEAGRPAPGLDGAQMKTLQARLQARGHDVGAVDGILGARTRAAVQAEQARLGQPADGWPTPALLSAL